MANSDEALMKAAAQLVRNGYDIVTCVGTSLGWAGQPNINAAKLRVRRIAAKAGVPLVKEYLGRITCYLKPVEILATKAAETQ